MPVRDLFGFGRTLYVLLRVSDQAENIAHETLFAASGEPKEPKVYRVVFVDRANDCRALVAEAYAPSFGALGIGGIAAFVFGAIIMFDTDVPGFGISYAFVTGIAVLFAALVIWLLSYLLKFRRRGAVSGRASIVGGIATVLEDFEGTGKVWLEGEAWQAHSPVPVKKDQEVVVRTMDGLVLDVEPVPDTGDAEQQ